MIGWVAVYLRHLVVALARCFWGTDADYEQARLRLIEHEDRAPWRRP